MTDILMLPVLADVCHIYAQYKMVMVFTMLSLAQRLANYVDWYDGMNY